MLHDDESSALRTENAHLRAENARWQAENTALRSALAAAENTLRQQQEALPRLETRLAELEQGTTPPWAKANTPRERPTKERKKRAPEHTAARRHAEPTRIVEHASERCPDGQ